MFGLPELNRENIKQSELVANPGCFPTTAILGLAPLLTEGMIESRGIIVDSKTGVTGAGAGAVVTRDVPPFAVKRKLPS